MARKKTQKSFSRGLPERPYQGILDEALAVIFFGFAGFIFLSVASFHLSSCAEPGTCVSANLLGPVGHVTATVLHGFLGWCALVPVVWALSLAIYCWRYDARVDKGEAALPSLSGFLWGLGGLALAVVALATIGAALAGRAGGGAIGAFLALPLVRLINVSGTLLLATLVLMFALALALQRTVGEVIVLFAGGVRATLMWAFGAAPRLLARALTFVLQSIQFGMLALVRRLGLRHLRVRDRSVPQPRLRRRSGDAEVRAAPDPEEESEPADVTSFDDEPDVELLEPRDLTDIVVERRDPSDLRMVLPGSRERHRVAQKATVKTIEQPAVPYEPPSIDLLETPEPVVGRENDDELRDKSRQIEMKLRDFGILGKVTHVHPGPVITLFEFEPAPGVKVGRIAALQDDLAMSLKASSIRILAPIPKRGTVGIEVPNRHRDMVRLRDCLESKEFLTSDSILSVPFGKDTYGDPVIVDIAAMPHLLIAGATGTGKSVCINALLVSLLYRADPDELGLILIDPKILELSTYDSVPHLRVPVVTVPRQAKAVLEWAVNEMNRRYRLMQRYGVRNIDGYNRMVRGEPDDESPKPKVPAMESVVELREEEVIASGTVTKDPVVDDEPLLGRGEELKPLSKIVIVIDELADLMLTVGKDIEELITRLAQKARASGIHLMVATQRPSVDVITGLIKANFPARISFRVTTRVDSRTILDSMGAEKLLGRGDMLFMAPGADSLKRLHGAFVSDNEVKKVVDWLKKQGAPRFDERIMAICEKALEDDANQGTSGAAGGDGGPAAEADPLYDRAVELVLQKGQASTSMIQRAFRIGYNRAARLVDFMEKEGVVGPADGARPRDVLVHRGEMGGGDNEPSPVTLDDSKF